uniref:Uncharacterized protein n=1 Tax=Tanacetum cinerariifolium TaxID=118510 RepID=A0A699PWK6_TANCI|nr:hypothetical protein [Tanacetum cinerariifolium]
MEQKPLQQQQHQQRWKFQSEQTPRDDGRSISTEGWIQKEMLLFVASPLQETYNDQKLHKESDLKPGLEFLQLNITLSLQQKNRLKQRERRSQMHLHIRRDQKR